MKKVLLLLIILYFNSIFPEYKKFAIIIPSFKNHLFYKKCLDSAIDQNYPRSKFRIVHIDDASPKVLINGQEIEEADLIEQYIIKKNATDIVIQRKNKIRRKALANLWSEFNLCDPDEIIVMLDGDDSLKDNLVLSYLNAIYSNPNVWLTYGQYECDPIKFGIGFAAPYSEKIIRERNFRSNFLATHLRTGYAWLFQKIKLDDLIYENNFLPMTWDLALMFPCLEMCGEKFRFISRILYKYNMNNPISDFKIDNNLMFKLATILKNKPKYPQIFRPEYPEIKNRYNNNEIVNFIYDIDKFLLPNININEKNNENKTPLKCAIEYKILSLAEYLMNKKFYIDEEDRVNYNLLRFKVKQQKLSAYKLKIRN